MERSGSVHCLPSETSTITPKILLNTRHPFLLIGPGPAILSGVLQAYGLATYLDKNLDDHFPYFNKVPLTLASYSCLTENKDSKTDPKELTREGYMLDTRAGWVMVKGE